MFEEIKNIKTDKKSIRSFGVTIGIILIAIAITLFAKNNLFLKSLGIISSVFLILGIIAPIMLKPFYLIWMIFAMILGWIMTRVILSLIFYFIVTPIGIIARLLGEDFLALKKVSSDSYWNIRDSVEELKQNYTKQF
tara:strand:- start:230 stop:640 length:411 start_codon:yes stop_codon:yes gene_type:complete